MTGEQVVMIIKEIDDLHDVVQTGVAIVCGFLAPIVLVAVLLAANPLW
jgi:hypothetical protein